MLEIIGDVLAVAAYIIWVIAPFLIIFIVLAFVTTSYIHTPRDQQGRRSLLLLIGIALLALLVFVIWSDAHVSL
jgi:hypothetical protein